MPTRPIRKKNLALLATVAVGALSIAYPDGIKYAYEHLSRPPIAQLQPMIETDAEVFAHTDKTKRGDLAEEMIGKTSAAAQDFYHHGSAPKKGPRTDLDILHDAKVRRLGMKYYNELQENIPELTAGPNPSLALLNTLYDRKQDFVLAVQESQHVDDDHKLARTVVRCVLTLREAVPNFAANFFVWSKVDPHYAADADKQAEDLKAGRPTVPKLDAMDTTIRNDAISIHYAMDAVGDRDTIQRAAAGRLVASLLKGQEGLLRQVAARDPDAAQQGREELTKRDEFYADYIRRQDLLADDHCPELAKNVARVRYNSIQAEMGTLRSIAAGTTPPKPGV